MPDIKEEWRDIEGHEGFYQVSNLGRVKSLGGWSGCVKRKPRIMKQFLHREGYLRLVLSLPHKKAYFVHRLVASAFVANPQNKKEVNHIDGNKENNCYTNLEWCTRSENIIHAFEKGLEKARNGTRAPRALFSEEQIKKIRSMYSPRDKKYGARALARQYGVHRCTIEKIIRMETYINE